MDMWTTGRRPGRSRGFEQHIVPYIHNFEDNRTVRSMEKVGNSSHFIFQGIVPEYTGDAASKFCRALRRTCKLRCILTELTVAHSKTVSTRSKSFSGSPIVLKTCEIPSTDLTWTMTR